MVEVFFCIVFSQPNVWHNTGGCQTINSHPGSAESFILARVFRDSCRYSPVASGDLHKFALPNSLSKSGELGAK